MKPYDSEVAASALRQVDQLRRDAAYYHSEAVNAQRRVRELEAELDKLRKVVALPPITSAPPPPVPQYEVKPYGSGYCVHNHGATSSLRARATGFQTKEAAALYATLCQQGSVTFRSGVVCVLGGM